MVTVDNESCGSMSMESKRPSTAAKNNNNNNRNQIQKLEVYNEILLRLKESNNGEAKEPGFDDELLAHFNRLPNRYALDVNIERAEDVLMHKRLLSLAHDPANGLVFDVRLVQVSPVTENNDDLGDCSSPGKQTTQSSHPPPAFGSSPNLEALAVEAKEASAGNGDNAVNSHTNFHCPMHEITFSTDDKPKLLSQETEELRDALERKLSKLEKQSKSDQQDQTGKSCQIGHLRIPNDGTDVWEIDPQFLTLDHKVASGSYGDLYKGTYRSQEVAIKMLKAERVNTDMQQEFAQEVYIMRKIRHKNVVQFIGACTKPSSLCIVTEFMSGGSVYDYLHKQKGTFKLPILLKVAIDISRGMNYLHQNNIIHRDLKCANLLMDENDVVKVADFGVARVKAQTGVMTAETGTYRWMAPELPYEYLTPVQAAIGVVQKGLRPTIPKNTQPKLAELLGKCWQKDPTLRPDFTEIIDILKKITIEVENAEERRTEKASGRFLSLLRRGHH
ncbi:hypothetical protein L2E82_10999 [Cichorium intybus]|uniref:Uncharacterized protein n=1 Tax=Cichorium intybus TaxID=13427 RepID=A0ACB9GDC5_CICIN|nr:hypothetical protein L2E82_10999 [Cichorium intybus]